MASLLLTMRLLRLRYRLRAIMRQWHAIGVAVGEQEPSGVLI